jgi:hypothetical protein
VREAWSCSVENVDACRALDIKLRATVKALKGWSGKNIGSVRSQLFMARELIAQLDVAQETRTLTDQEILLRAELKKQSLRLASLSRTIAHNRSRVRFLEEGDANTKFFHLQTTKKYNRSSGT